MPIYAQSAEADAKLFRAGGNATAVLQAFFPQSLEIKPCMSVTWKNPTLLAEPHSITFLKDQKYFAVFAVPFRVTKAVTNLRTRNLIRNQSFYLHGQEKNLQE